MLYRSRCAALIAFVLLLPIPTVAGAQSGIQVSPDLSRILVSKDVGAERWAISRDLASGSVSGNVFFPGGGSPRFVWCDQTGSSADSLMLSCSGSSRCLLAPCGSEAWEFVADVSLPLSFFAPRAVGAALACHATAQLGPRSSSPPSGLQTSPRGAVTLVSKDVGTERWAIARQGSDGSVTGNVFYPDGSDPRFVWCRQIGHTGGNFVLSCEGADACGESCSPADWTFIAEVALPESFFLPREQASIEEIQSRIDETLGDEDGVVALLLALDYGYSLEQVIHAVADGRLERNGLSRLRSGAVEPPDGPALGIYLETPARPDGAAGRSGAQADRPQAQTSVQEVRRKLLDDPQLASVFLFSAVMDCAAQGYSLDQITEALFFGRLRQGEFGDPYHDHWAWRIVDDAGNRVTPDDLPASFVEPPAAPAPTPQPTVRPTPSPTPPGGPDCGNGRVDATEECDGANLGGETCVRLGFAGGTLRCTARCTYDVTGCTDVPPPTPAPTPPVCEGFFCPDGVCAPSGSDCCGNQRYCPPGRLCVGSDKCCPADASQLCGNLCIPPDAQCCGGVGFCSAGYVCAGGNTACCPSGLPQLCGDFCTSTDATCCSGGGVCGPGYVCTGVAGTCCPAAFPQICGSTCIPEGADCCGGGAGYCPPGSQCRSDGTCSGLDGVTFESSESVIELQRDTADATLVGALSERPPDDGNAFGSQP